MAKDASGNDDQESQNLPPALPALQRNVNKSSRYKKKTESKHKNKRKV
jgi:hypothetical protein